MVQTRNPAGEGGASHGSVQAAKLNTSEHTQATATHQVLCGCLSGSVTGSAAGGTGTGHAPAFELCRRLVAVGHDPTTAPMHVYRDATLGLTVRSIGEATHPPGSSSSGGVAMNAPADIDKTVASSPDLGRIFLERAAARLLLVES